MTECSDAVIEDLTGNTGAAVVAAISAIFLIIGAIGAIPLCSGFSDDEEDK